MTELRSAEDLEAALRAIGEERYHDKHAFHGLMVRGELTREQIAAWALNRYYYQCRIPIKDAAVLMRLEDTETRRTWRQRLVDHDGVEGDDGGIERWLRLTDSLGFDRGYVISTAGILPGTRFAVDAYLRIVRERSVLEAVGSCLTEMFSPRAINTRVSGMLANYDFISAETLGYFDKRLSQAPRDANFALDYVKREARTPEQRELVCQVLRDKCAILWAQLDALYHAYVEPGHIPPGAWDPATRKRD